MLATPARLPDGVAPAGGLPEDLDGIGLTTHDPDLANAGPNTEGQLPPAIVPQRDVGDLHEQQRITVKR